MSRCLTYEFEDVIAECDDWVRLEQASVPAQRSVQRRLWRARMGVELLLDRRHHSGGDELVFAMAQSPQDLIDHQAFRSVIQSAATSAAYLEELWISDIPLQNEVRRWLRQFDHVFLAEAATVEPLAEHIDRPVSFLPPSVDQNRFAVSPWPPTAIDVYAMGRREPAMHEALLRWAAADRSRFYLYDTFRGNVPVVDHQQHRDKLADLIRRSRYFLVNWGRFDIPGVIGSQSEIGYRFFEGAAGGAVMIGPKISSPMFDKLFDWEEPVVWIDPSGEDIAERIKELDEDPDRRAAIRHRNVMGSLRAHDPAHRWRTVLETLGLEEPPGVGDRIRRLAKRAEDIAEKIDLSDTDRQQRNDDL
jgi:hypothetical protein